MAKADLDPAEKADLGREAKKAAIFVPAAKAGSDPVARAVSNPEAISTATEVREGLTAAKAADSNLATTVSVRVKILATNKFPQ